MPRLTRRPGHISATNQHCGIAACNSSRLVHASPCMHVRSQTAVGVTCQLIETLWGHTCLHSAAAQSLGRGRSLEMSGVYIRSCSACVWFTVQDWIKACLGRGTQARRLGESHHAAKKKAGEQSSHGLANSGRPALKQGQQSPRD